MVATLILPLLVALTACAAMQRPVARDVGGAERPATLRGSYIMSVPELVSHGTRSLLEVVDVRWPGMVSGAMPRGGSGTAIREIGNDLFAVYDARGVMLGGPEVLASARPRDVREVRRLTPVEEFSKFGHSHPAGAVVVSWYEVRR